MTTLVVTNTQIAASMRMCATTFRCFRNASAPQQLPYERIPSEKPRVGFERAYHVGPVLEWLKRACPHRVNSASEAQLMASAASNLVKMESAQ